MRRSSRPISLRIIGNHSSHASSEASPIGHTAVDHFDESLLIIANSELVQKISLTEKTFQSLKKITRRHQMKFIFLGTMSAESVNNMHTTSHEKRRKMADIVATRAGGNVLDMTFSQGIYDMVAVMDLPDASSAIGAKAAVLASGAYSTVDILSEFDLNRAGKVQEQVALGYKGMGQE